MELQLRLRNLELGEDLYLAKAGVYSDKEFDEAFLLFVKWLEGKIKEKRSQWLDERPRNSGAT